MNNIILTRDICCVNSCTQTSHENVQAEEGADQHDREGAGAPTASALQADLCGWDGGGKIMPIVVFFLKLFWGTQI